MIARCIVGPKKINPLKRIAPQPERARKSHNSSEHRPEATLSPARYRTTKRAKAAPDGLSASIERAIASAGELRRPVAHFDEIQLNQCC
jgi:hypothetical protein